MKQVENAADGTGCRFVLRPNRSASWRETQAYFAAVVVVAALISTYCAALGAWLVFPFAGVEMLALGAALYACARHTYRCELIAVADGEVAVWRGVGEPRQCWRFPRAWVRVHLEPRARGARCSRLRLGAHGRYVEVGAFLHEQERQELARELARTLRRQPVR